MALPLSLWAGENSQENKSSPAPVANPKVMQLGEIKDWLSRRNQERKALGLPGADLVMQKHFAHHNLALSHPHLKTKLTKSKLDTLASSEPLTPPTPKPQVLHFTRGADGRIHVVYVQRDEGPDQIQSAVADANSKAKEEEKAHMERLTPRGKELFLSGSMLRYPIKPTDSEDTCCAPQP